MQWLYFFGRFHPLLVHLPIGILLVALAMEIASRRTAYAHLRPAVPFVLLLGAVSATATALLGYWLSLEGGYEGNTLDIHRWSGIGVAVLSWTLYLAAARRWEKTYTPLFAVTVLTLIVAGHYGGALTHGSDYLTEQAPPPLDRLLGAPAATLPDDLDMATADSMALYIAVVQPILQDKCVSCHRSGKSKGELRLDGPERIARGGDAGPVFVAGDPENSRLLQRIHLPLEHDEHMPPEGKAQLDEAEKQLLEWWIAEGGSFDRSIAAHPKTEAIQRILEARFAPVVANPVYALEVEPLPDEQLQSLRAAGLPLRPLAMDSPWLEADLSGADSLQAKQLAQLKEVADQLLRLNLGNSNISDELLPAISELPHLTHLYLDRTNIGDAGLDHLQQFQYLEYLNLYQTKVTDDGLSRLQALPQLRQLYLWQTDVTASGAASLEQALPKLRIDLGMSLDSTLSVVQ